MQHFAPFAGIIKICGITNLDDALRSVDCGAHALGFNFYPQSPRCLDPAKAEDIVSRLPNGILTVAVVVGQERLAAVRPQKWSFVQFHGARSEAELPDLGCRFLVATSAGNAANFPDHAIIIDDSWGKGKKGNWEELKRLNRPFILSGGLTPENVQEAIDFLAPAGVDVCSGVESRPGRKDTVKLKTFIENARRAFAA